MNRYTEQSEKIIKNWQKKSDLYYMPIFFWLLGQIDDWREDVDYSIYIYPFKRKIIGNYLGLTEKQVHKIIKEMVGLGMLKTESYRCRHIINADFIQK